MKFLTSCFVRVENPAERKELIEWLVSVGYIETTVRCVPIETEEWTTVFTSTQGIYALLPSNNPRFNPFTNNIDCDTNTELFKALAAMNDCNDREQWFLNERFGSWILSHVDVFKWRMESFRKATTAEIVEYFKCKK